MSYDTIRTAPVGVGSRVRTSKLDAIGDDSGISPLARKIP
jgi:hypothetical protein